MIRFPLVSVAALAAASLAVAAGAQTAPAPAAPATTPVPATPAASPASASAPDAGAPRQVDAAGTVTPGSTTQGAVPTVGGAQMLPTRSIVENAAQASNLSTLVRAVRAAELADTLSGPGPFTVFAPTDAAFGRLAPGTVDTLLQPANKATLAKVLNYHVVQGDLDAAALQAQVEAGGGTARLTTVAGEPIVATLENGAITLADASGNKSYISQYDVRQSNGVVHVVNGVLVPTLN